MSFGSEHTAEGTMLPVVEDFFSLQGEGYHSGKAAYFIRIGGCDVGCNWCDSKSSWNPDIHPMVGTEGIINRIAKSGTDSVVVTGGEPLMWNLDYLCDAIKNKNIKTFLETSGSHPFSGRWDWVCLSPKKSKPPLPEICERADELKIIVENVSDFIWAEKYRYLVNEYCLLFLQPEWSRFDKIVPEIVEYIKNNSHWRISLQIHKYMHIP
jgi:7-carboxy-7-deazaguanine synthase